MHLIEKHIIKPSNELYGVLDDLCFKSKNLYNKANYIIRQEFIGNKIYLNYFTLQKMLQDANDIDYRSLPATCSQQTLKLLDQNWKSFFRSIKDYSKNKNKYNGVPELPKYKHKKKGRFVVIFTKNVISKKHLKEGILKLSGIDYQIKIRNKTDIRQDTIQQVRIIPVKNKYYKIEIVYKKQEKEPKPKKNRIVAVDIGIDNLMAVTSNVVGLRPFIVNGRPLKSINQYYNKRRSILLGSLMKQHKNKYTSRKIEALTFKRNQKIDDYLHKASRLLVNYCIENDIDTVAIGYNPKWKQDVNMGKVNNQNFTSIPFDRLIQMIEYKCKLEGIEVILVNEAYTSKCSALDLEDIGKKESYLGKRISRGLFKTKDGIIINADINGSFNILRKASTNCDSNIANVVEGLRFSPVRLNIGRNSNVPCKANKVA
jgi:putative transposase